MDTLSNVYSREGGNLLSSARLIPCTISCQNKTGVSVENAQQNSEDTSQQKQMKQWFVLRVAYHHEQIAKDWLAKVGITSYLPMHYVVKEINGRKKRVQKPLVPNLLFAQAAKEKIDLALASPDNSYLSYYYNHFKTNADGKNPPLVVRDKQMDDFIRLTSINSDHILFVDRSQCHFKNGDRVIITDGDFRGIEGRVARVARQQRVVVELDGIGCITTAYIRRRGNFPWIAPTPLTKYLSTTFRISWKIATFAAWQGKIHHSTTRYWSVTCFPMAFWTTSRSPR